MTCAEFEAVLPELLEDAGTAEQRAHMSLCSACSNLVSEINVISQQARLMRASDEPSPRVWNSIEIALRQEGLVHEPGVQLAPAAGSPWRHWTVAWLLPASAAFLVTLGILRYERPAAPTTAEHSAPVAAGPAVAAASQPAPPADANEDKQLLEAVGTRSPSMRASYEKELRHVNDYIRDAEQSAKANPDDEEAQEYLMNAYEQKAMVYELAMDRSLP